MSFALTSKQLEGQSVLAGLASHIAGEGGSRSGKTFLFLHSIVNRAMLAPKSRHAVFRFRFNHLKASIIADTFPKVMELGFPSLRYEMDRTDWFAEMDGGSQVWFCGLDDKARTEKVLGQEYVTEFLNEISQIPKSARDIALTRLAQRVEKVVNGKPAGLLRPKMYYDLNPTNRGHWAFKMFHQKIDPDTKQPLSNPNDYAYFQINPEDNSENLSPTYLETLRSLSGRMQRRFLKGEYAEENPYALFSEADIDKWRQADGQKLPDMVRVVVAVDPSGSGDTDNADNDAIGIVAAGLGTDGNAYLLEDATLKAGPATWGKVATSLFDRHNADVIVGEQNYGGDMVRQTIQTARPRTAYKKVTATRGKVVRAEPYSALYETGKVRHVGYFPELEDELCAFSTNGYTGPGSPNRADALIWALAELFPGMTKAAEEPKKPVIRQQSRDWMAA